jgi:hypothetical protein
MPTHDEHDEQVSAERKVAYTSPEIVWVGEVVELTAGASGDAVDGSWPNELFQYSSE